MGELRDQAVIIFLQVLIYDYKKSTFEKGVHKI